MRCYFYVVIYLFSVFTRQEIEIYLEYMFSLPEYSNMMYNTLTASNENTVISIYKRCSSNKHQPINSTMFKTKTMIGDDCYE